MAAAGVDIGYLESYLGTPQDTLVTATTNPTADLVISILAAVVSKAHENDSVYSENVQLKVELETNVRGAEAQRDASNETARKALKDLEDIRQRLKEEGESYSRAVPPMLLASLFLGSHLRPAPSPFAIC